jgi:hypothetical protein
MRPLLLVLLLLPAARASADAVVAEGTTKTGTKASLTLGGYAEAFYQWNFNEPQNGITNFRGFDNRHNSFTIANAAVDAQGILGPVEVRLVFQVGHTPNTYYLAEPVSPGASGAAATDAATWKFIQQATVAYTAPLGRGLRLEGGVFLSPIGPETIPIKDNWNWSRSNLFFGLPFYHTGIRVGYPITDRWTVKLHAYNGWNSVVDNNPEKSIMATVNFEITDKVSWQLLYFTGVERPVNAPEGNPWRHLFDSFVYVHPRKWVSLLFHVNGGFEPNLLGTSWWAAGAAYLRFQPLSWLYLAGRQDFFYEGKPAGAAAIFWPADYVTSTTLTADFRPYSTISFRVEYRHDYGAQPMFFRRALMLDPMGAPIPNARPQDTLTLGAVAWF